MGAPLLSVTARSPRRPAIIRASTSPDWIAAKVSSAIFSRVRNFLDRSVDADGMDFSGLGFCACGDLFRPDPACARSLDILSDCPVLLRVIPALSEPAEYPAPQ